MVKSEEYTSSALGCVPKVTLAVTILRNSAERNLLNLIYLNVAQTVRTP